MTLGRVRINVWGKTNKIPIITLPRKAIEAKKIGESITVPTNRQAYRVRTFPKVLVGEAYESLEQEPNQELKQAQKISTPAVINGQISTESADKSSDVDLYQFSSQIQTWF